jgi:hypothetical protein
MDPLQAGIAAARDGRNAEARDLLKKALQADPFSEQGWLWMSAVVETDPERRVCLERVLDINPRNQTAKEGLDRLSSSGSLEDGPESYVPVPQSAAAANVEHGQVAVGEPSASQVAAPLSPHHMPTLAMDPVAPSPRPVRRLVPQSEPPDDLAQLRASQFQTASGADAMSSQETDSFTALVLLGGLSITAVAGALMLGVLLLIGWPP